MIEKPQFKKLPEKKTDKPDASVESPPAAANDSRPHPVLRETGGGEKSAISSLETDEVLSPVRAGDLSRERNVMPEISEPGDGQEYGMAMWKGQEVQIMEEYGAGSVRIRFSGHPGKKDQRVHRDTLSSLP